MALHALSGATARVHAQDDKQACLSSYASSQKQRNKGALLAARKQLLVCSRNVCPGPVVKDCMEWLTDVDANLSSVVFAVSDASGHDIVNARVTAQQELITDTTDGHAVLLDPGMYEFQIEADGYERAESTVIMHQAEKNRMVRVQLKRPPSAAPRKFTLKFQPEPATVPASAPAVDHPFPVVTTVLAGVALAGVGTFAYLGVRGLNTLHEARRCQANCRRTIDSGTRDYVVADIGLGVAIAAAVSAALVYFLVESNEPEVGAGTRSHQLQSEPALTRMAF